MFSKNESFQITFEDIYENRGEANYADVEYNIYCCIFLLLKNWLALAIFRYHYWIKHLWLLPVYTPNILQDMMVVYFKALYVKIQILYLFLPFIGKMCKTIQFGVILFLENLGIPTTIRAAAFINVWKLLSIWLGRPW